MKLASPGRAMVAVTVLVAPLMTATLPGLTTVPPRELEVEPPFSA